ncbi:MAG TPA: type II secretion system F family protein [bacterium]|nr:type II secretion system F family protein [bacterium]HQG46955.1 type II secretion system F family protein [bacterium]HQI48285.1 type II secretion system F family protein [bacterium]HQJ64901.1 type II secretion system F family protein [bacterium]
MTLYLVLAGVFLAAFSLFFLLLRRLRNRLDPTTRRVKKLVAHSTTASEPVAIHDALRQSDLPAGIEKMLITLGRLGKSSEKERSRSKQLLLEAGIQHEYAPVMLMGMRILSLLFFVLCYFLFVHRLIAQPLMALAAPLLVILISMRLPDLVLRYHAAQRRQEIGESLADALDLLVICMEAGLGLNAALLRVAQELGLRAPVLSSELLQVTQEMRTGLAREKALRNLCERNKVENLRILVGALILADKLGTSVGDTLRAQADSLRTRLRQSAEEQAAKAGIKMLFPLVLFIFPALFIVLLGPGFMSIMKTFSTITGR